MKVHQHLNTSLSGVYIILAILRIIRVLGVLQARAYSATYCEGFLKMGLGAIKIDDPSSIGKTCDWLTTRKYSWK